MICGVFGLPRAGKSTFLTREAMLALKQQRKAEKFASRNRKLLRKKFRCKQLSIGHLMWQKNIGEFAPYKRIFCNFPLSGAYKLDFDSLGVYDFSDSLIIIDEIMLLCDSRDWKNFRANLRDFLALHGHYRCDIIYCSQGYQDTDLRIRNLTERIFYIEKKGAWTRVRPIDKGWSFDEQIREGYDLAPPLGSTWIYRKKYYKHFDSFAAPQMPENPALLWDDIQCIPFYMSGFERLSQFFLNHLKKQKG